MLLQLNTFFRIADCAIPKVFIIRKNSLWIRQSITTYTLRIVQCVIVLTALLISHSIMLLIQLLMEESLMYMFLRVDQFVI